MSSDASVSQDDDEASSPLWRRVVATLLVGIAAGIGGLVLALLLHAVQHLAYGYRLDDLFGPEDFLGGVRAASGQRRVIVLAACGLMAGLGWWALDRFARPRVDVSRAVSADDPRMPVATSFVHALLQIVTVALGSPLGREVAPRELGAALAGRIASAFGLRSAESRVLVACGAGAGLAAVYNVPLAGAVFVMEVLLATFAWRVMVPALATSVVAAMVAWLGLGDVHQYVVPAFAVDGSLIAWSIVAGPLFGVAAFGFRTLTNGARRHPVPKGWRRVLVSVAVFVAIGLVATQLPEVLGNGKVAAQLGFAGDLGVVDAGEIVLVKLLVVMAALWVGAHGGLLTPGLACGALLATVLGAGWSMWWPGPASGAYALVGAAAFLSASMAMPLTAILLVFEFTRIGHDFVVPILVAVAGAAGVARGCARFTTARSRSGA